MHINPDAIRISLFKDSKAPFIALLDEQQVQYNSFAALSGIPMASGEWIEVVKSAALWGGLATVVVAFLKYRHGRKVIITTNDNTVIHAEGLTHAELEQVLQHAKSITAIQTEPHEA